MRPVFHCQACGFVSTLGTQFVRIEGVLVDKQCASDFKDKKEPCTQWVEAAIAQKECRHG